MIEQFVCGSPLLQTLICEPLSWPFMQKAFLVVIVLGIVAGVIGAYVVVRGMAFLTDALAHAILPGVGIAFLTGGIHGPLMFGGMVAAAITAFLIGLFTRGGKLREDTAIGVVFTGALALGIAILSLAKANATNFEDLLVGNILAISEQDIVVIMITAAVILILVRIFYKELLIASFDPVLGATLQYSIEGLRFLLLFMLALTAVIAIQAVGVVLIAAMLVTPAATAYLLVRRLHLMMFIGALICSGSGVLGLLISYQTNIAASAAIVLTMTVFFLLAFLFSPKRGILWLRLQHQSG